MTSCPKCRSPKICGHEEPYVYDGIAYWGCEDCGYKWHRFPEGDGVRKRLAKVCPDLVLGEWVKPN